MKSIEWLAGLLEGEGCFSDMRSGPGGKHRTPLISCWMTDGDVIEEAQAVITEIGGRPAKINSRIIKSGKTVYGVFITGLPAVKIMWAVLPHMGQRRSAKILDIISSWNPVVYKDAIAFRKELQEKL